VDWSDICGPDHSDPLVGIEKRFLAVKSVSLTIPLDCTTKT